MKKLKQIILLVMIPLMVITFSTRAHSLDKNLGDQTNISLAKAKELVKAKLEKKYNKEIRYEFNDLEETTATVKGKEEKAHYLIFYASKKNVFGMFPPKVEYLAQFKNGELIDLSRIEGHQMVPIK